MTDIDGKIVRSVKPVVVGQLIGVKLTDGRLTSIVKSKESEDQFR